MTSGEKGHLAKEQNLLEQDEHDVPRSRPLADTDLDAIAEKFDTIEYDVEALKTRRRSRPATDSGSADVVPHGVGT